MAYAGFNTLPEEIVQCILTFSTPASALALAQTSRKFWCAVDNPLLWRFYCKTIYSYWDPRHHIREKFNLPVHEIDWKEIYKERRLVDISVTDTLESILSKQPGRIEKFHAIVRFGYDSKDELLRHAGIASDKEDHLARRYYSKAVLGCLHRAIAISEWSQLKRAGNVPIERAIGAFDMFVLGSGIGDLEYISASLNGIATEFESHYNLSDLTPRQKAIKISEYLQAKNLTGMNPEKEYFDIEHNFIGLALQGDDHDSLPLISAVIYCSIAQTLRLDAKPCGFPFHVHVIIRPEIGYDMDGRSIDSGQHGTAMYMDPFRSAFEIPEAELEAQLSLFGALATPSRAFLNASSTSEIVLRCARNIINSVAQVRRSPGELVEANSAEYAALWAIMTLAEHASNNHQAGPPQALRNYLPSLMEQFDANFSFDVHLIENYLLPLFRGFPDYDHLRESIYVMKVSDEIPKQVRKRLPEHKNVRYRVGQVLNHRRYGYIAVITGWDPECDAGEQWMRQMGVDRLGAGRHQSFYRVLVEDKSVRYIAEENIEVVTPDISQIPRNFLESLGQYFKRWDHQTRSFVSNIRDEYPDD